MKTPDAPSSPAGKTRIPGLLQPPPRGAAIAVLLASALLLASGLHGQTTVPAISGPTAATPPQASTAGRSPSAVPALLPGPERLPSETSLPGVVVNPEGLAPENSLPGALAVEPALAFEAESFVVEEYRPLALVGFRVGPISTPSPIRVRFDVVGGTAAEGEDYWIDVKTVVVDPGIGSLGWGFLRIRLQDVDAPEPDETILLDASIEGSAVPPVRIEVRIRDAQAPGAVGFVSTRFSANEAAGVAQVRLFRTKDPSPEGSAVLSYEGDSTLANALGASGSVTALFRGGDSQAVVEVPIAADSIAQGYRELRLRLVSASGGMTTIPELSETLLTVADDESAPPLGPLDIARRTSEGREGVQLTLQIPRGYQARIEYTDSGMEGPWTVLTDVLGSGAEGFAFDSFQSGVQRMYRAVGPSPLEVTLPW